MLKINFISRSVCVLLGLMPQAFAWAAAGDGFKVGPLRVMPTAGLTFAHDSNVALTSEDEVDSFLTLFSPGVRVEAGSEFNRFTAGYQMEIGRYDSSSLDNFNDHTFNLEWAWNPLVRHALVVDASWARRHDERGTASREGDLALLPLDPDEFDQNGFGGRYRFGAPGARGRLELEARWNDIEYRNNRQYTVFRDRAEQLLAAGFYWRLAPKTSAVVRVDHVQQDYDTATLDSTERHYLVGVEFDATARTSGSILVGRGQKRFDDPAREDFSGTSWRAGVKYKLRSYSVLELTTGRDTDETNGFGDFILRRDTTLAWLHQWSDRFSSQADIGFAHDEHRPSLRTDDSAYYGLSGQYRVAPWLQLGAGYRVSERDSDISELNYNRNQLMLSVEASL
jgi:polysaccharide biosynthesis protein VpsM